MNRVVPWYSAIPPATKVMATAGGLLLATVGVLVVDALGYYGIADGVASHGNHDAAREFQRMAGGLGLGASVRPRWCFVNFDPRLGHCTCAEQPIPGGYCYCPEHTGTVTFFAAEEPKAANAKQQGIAE